MNLPIIATKTTKKKMKLTADKAQLSCKWKINSEAREQEQPAILQVNWKMLLKNLQRKKSLQLSKIPRLKAINLNQQTSPVMGKAKKVVSIRRNHFGKAKVHHLHSILEYRGWARRTRKAQRKRLVVPVPSTKNSNKVLPLRCLKAMNFHLSLDREKGKLTAMLGSSILERKYKPLWLKNLMIFEI